MKVRDVLRLLADDGWVLDRTRGSHRQFSIPPNPASSRSRALATTTSPDVPWWVSSSKQASAPASRS